MVSLGLFAVSGRHQFTVGSWVVLLQFLGNNEGWKYVRFMADKCDTKATPQSGFKSYYCYGKDLQGEGGKREVSYTASFLCLQVQFLIWWGVNMCFWGGVCQAFQPCKNLLSQIQCCCSAQQSSKMGAKHCQSRSIEFIYLFCHHVKGKGWLWT